MMLSQEDDTKCYQTNYLLTAQLGSALDLV